MRDDDLLTCSRCSSSFPSAGFKTVCPTCGQVIMSVSDSVSITAELVAHKVGPSRSAVRILSDAGRRIAADADASMPMTQSISARPRENESNTEPVCRILLESLNAQRGTNGVEPLTNVERVHNCNSDEDALIYNSTEEIAIQVTRPEQDPNDPKWKNAVVGKFYRPIKQPVGLRVDADVLAWLKSQGPGYQTRANQILRKAMVAALKKRSA